MQNISLPSANPT